MSSLTGPIIAEYTDLFTSSTTAGGMLIGQKAYTGDGREFRFALASALTAVGKLYQSAAETTTWENIAVNAAAKNATSVTISASITTTANVLNGGYLIVAVTPGVGYTYKIKSHTVVSAATGCVITLEDPILVALTASSTVTLVTNPYSNVLINPTTQSGSPAGVSIFPIAASAYGWLQVTGACGVLADDALTVGTQVAPSEVVAGAVTPANVSSSVFPNVGVAINGISDTQYGPIWLNIG